MNILLEPAQSQGENGSCEDRHGECEEKAHSVLKKSRKFAATEANEAEDDADACNLQQNKAPAVEGGARSSRSPLFGHFGDSVIGAVAGRPPQVFKKTFRRKCRESCGHQDAHNPRSSLSVRCPVSVFDSISKLGFHSNRLSDAGIRGLHLPLSAGSDVPAEGRMGSRSRAQQCGLWGRRGRRRLLR